MATTDLDLGRYQLGWSDAEDYVFKPKKGLNESIVREMSEMKDEPEWMRDFRLRSLKHFERKPMAPWFATQMPSLDFDDIYYYIKPTGGQVNDWDDLPDAIKNTYEKLGIPEAERKYLSGVTAQYESEVVFHRNREDLEAQGVLFSDMDTAVREYPEIVRKWFGKIIPPNDNKFAALNSAVWSGGSFIYVPPGVKVDMPLQAYFRINAENMGQFERTLIIADEGSQVHYIEGCSAPVYSTDSLHSAVVELVALQGSRITYTTIQNWSTNVYNLVTKRARAEAEAHVEWIDGNIGSRLTMKYPSVYLMGPKASGEVLSVAYAGAGQHQDTGAKMFHCAPETTSTIVSKSISKDGGITTYRGKVHVDPDATGRQVLRPLRRAPPRRGVDLRDEAVHGGGRARRPDRARGDGVKGRRRPALLPDEPGPLGAAGDEHDRERLHRAGDPDAADGVRRRVEPADRAADGRLGRLTRLQRHLRRGTIGSCRCVRSASTSRAGRTRPARWPASARSTWHRRRRGVARTTAPRYRRRMADVGWVHGSLVEPAIEDEPGSGGSDVAELLESAEDIVNEVAPDVLDEVRAEDARKERSASRWWRRKR